MFKKTILIVVPIIIVIALIFGYGIIAYNSKYVTFQANGHIIAKKSKSTTEKYNFDTDTKYKEVDDEIVLTTKDNKTITIPKESFIHYADGSISTFSKSVVLDLDDLNKENYKYYNIFLGTVFVKNGGNYTVNYLDKKLSFSNFLLKINDEKFMIIGKDITLTIGDQKRTLKNNYLEITYLEGNVIKIENQEVSFQSVSDELIIELGNDVAIDFVGKNIYKDAVRKISLGEITVDSDDNIEINAEDNLSITGKKKAGEGEEGTEGSEGTDGQKTKVKKQGPKKYTKDELPTMNSGVVDTTTDNLEEIIDANARIADPEFKIVNLNVTANKIDAGVQIIDKEGILDGDINIKIIESNTNKIIYETNDDSGSNLIEITNETLVPETNYILVLNSNYKKNDVTYNKDFIQKTFVTDAIGVDTEKYFVSENRLQVNLIKASYSEVESVDVALEDNTEKTLKTFTVPLNVGDNIVDFTELTNDTRYKVRIYNFVYKNLIVTDNFTILNTYETLKKKPTIGSTSFTMDKKESKFNMMINNVLDPDGGITSYKYMLYDARTVTQPDATPITTIEKNNTASATVKVDGINISRGVPYVFKVVMTFNDNEKEYDYQSEFSEVMKLDGVSFPLVQFNKSEITFERIAGEIEIIDDDSTININDDKPITVTYTDSIGNSQSLTTKGSLRIPIDINNLRANETYSFAVYARVDLQDGNPAVDNCFIGSVIIKTEDPNPFQVNFEVYEDPSYTFSVDAQIKNGTAGNTELEASTLTGLNFNLYQGKSTKGTLVKTIQKVDRDLEPYSSDLRTEFYDSVFRLDPSFFGMRNSDLTSEYYTIEVTGAYDYTTFQNRLPIGSNVVTVKSQNALPDMPENSNDSVDFIPIRNRDMATPREDLQDATIVGYKFKSIYNNDSKYATKIHYKIHDLDGNVLKTIDYIVPNTGVIDYSEIYLGDGLDGNATDDNIHRGQAFYISYTIDLDTNFDTETDLVYPLSGELRGKTLTPERQKPTFEMYPSKNDGSSYTWKYTYKDVDHTLLDKKVYAYMNGEEISAKEVTATTTYKEVAFNVSSSGLFAIYGKYNYQNSEDPVSTLLTSHHYEGIRTLDFGNVAIYPEKNRVIFSFLNYNEKMELFEKISAVKIEFVAGNDKVTLDGLSAKSGNITISYSLIESLLGKTITPKMTIYYDSGIYGFDNTGDVFAFQQIRTTDTDPLYYYSFEDKKFNTRDSADGSYTEYTFNINNKTLNITDKITNTSNTYSVFINQNGVAYNGTFITPKKLNSSTPTVTGEKSFSFDSIIPGVSLIGEDGTSTINPLINTATVGINTYGFEGKIQNNKIYLELYQSEDDTASEVTHLRDIDVAISNGNTSVTIENLLPTTNYYFKIYAYVKNASGDYDKSYLYDVDSQRDGVNYYFKTIGNVGITNLSARYYALNYDNRNIALSYRLDKIIGYSYIKYRVYRVIDEDTEDEVTGVEAPQTTIFKTNMSNILIKIPNTSGFITGDTYRIEVIPVLTAKVNGVSQDIELESASTKYRFNNLYRPYISINQTSSSDTLNYRINFRDYNKTVVNGVYRIKITNPSGTDITPAEYKDKNISITEVNKQIQVTGLQKDVIYTLTITYGLDIYNDHERIQQATYTRNSKVTDASAVDLGTIYADPDASDNTKINLRFFDSKNIQADKGLTLRYSIYSENDFSTDGQVAFKPKTVTSGSTSYLEFQLPDTISLRGIYYISMQFIDKNGVLLAEDTVEYRYL